MYGIESLTCPGMFLKKPWTIESTLQELSDGLAIQCDGKHSHIDARGTDCKMTEDYTDPMVDRIHQIFMLYCKRFNKEHKQQTNGVSRPGGVTNSHKRSVNTNTEGNGSAGTFTAVGNADVANDCRTCATKCFDGHSETKVGWWWRATN